MSLDKFNMLISNIKNIAKDPELFLASKDQTRRKPIGFRIEIYTARKLSSICRKLKWFKLTNIKATGIVPTKSKELTTHFSRKKHPEKTFCPYCEKAVVPKRLHKLDFADIIITLLTAGLWAISLFIMYLFLRRCPVCNYDLRGFKFLTDKKKR